VAAEYQDHFGEHAYDEQGNYIGPVYEEAVAEADAEAAAAEEAPAAPAEAVDAPPADAASAPAAVGTDNEGDGA